MVDTVGLARADSSDPLIGDPRNKLSGVPLHDQTYTRALSNP